MRTQPIASFADIQTVRDNFERADAALSAAVTKGNQAAVLAALRAGANPLQAQDASGTHLLLQALRHPNGEDLVCELLNQMPAIERLGRDGQGRLQLGFAGGHAMAVAAGPDGDQADVDRLGRLLAATVVWRANCPLRENETLNHVRLRDLNRRLADGARAGDVAAVESAMAEGATGLATDTDGTPVLTLASEHPQHTALLASIFATEPSLHLVELEGGTLCLCTLTGARRGKGGVAPYVTQMDDACGAPMGHSLPLDPRFLTPVLQAHLLTLSDLGRAMQGLTTEFAQRGMTTTLTWPNLIDFQRLLGDRFDVSLARVAPVADAA